MLGLVDSGLKLFSQLPIERLDLLLSLEISKWESRVVLYSVFSFIPEEAKVSTADSSFISREAKMSNEELSFIPEGRA